MCFNGKLPAAVGDVGDKLDGELSACGVGLDGMDTATCSSGNPGETVLFHDGRNGRKEWLQ